MIFRNVLVCLLFFGLFFFLNPISSAGDSGLKLLNMLIILSNSACSVYFFPVLNACCI